MENCKIKNEVYNEENKEVKFMLLVLLLPVLAVEVYAAYRWTTY